MSFTIKVEFQCPYCEHTNIWNLEPRFGSRALYFCEAESGGCDRMFVGEMKFEVLTVVRTVEGEAQKQGANDPICEECAQ